jgi:hypothetical protein
MIKRLELLWSHSSNEAEIIACIFLRKEITFRNVPLEVWLVKVFFLHSFDKDVNCAYSFQGVNIASIRKMKIGEYHLTWQKNVDILKQDGHILFGGQKIQEGIKDKDIKDTYEKFMSPLDNMLKMSLFFVNVQIRVVKDMVHKDIALFQKNWEQIDEKQGEASLLNIRRYLQRHEAIHMGWINMH